MNSRNHRILFILLLAVFTAGVLALSRVRPLDGDEGYYGLAATLTMRSIVGDLLKRYLDVIYKVYFGTSPSPPYQGHLDHKSFDPGTLDRVPVDGVDHLKPLTILGVTGSIGQQALDVAERQGLPVAGIAAYRGSPELLSSAMRPSTSSYSLAIN